MLRSKPFAMLAAVCLQCQRADDFQIGASLTKEVVVGNATYRVTVTVEPIQGGTINPADAEVALTEAMHEFPQRKRSGP
jgi:hypothetical protein